MPEISEALRDLGADLVGVRLAPPSVVRARGDQRRRRQYSAVAALAVTAVGGAVAAGAGVPIATGGGARPATSAGPATSACVPPAWPSASGSPNTTILITWDGTPPADVVARIRNVPDVLSVTAESPAQVAARRAAHPVCGKGGLVTHAPEDTGLLIIEAVLDTDRAVLQKVRALVPAGLRDSYAFESGWRGELPVVACEMLVGIDEFTTVVKVTREATPAQRDAIQAVLDALPQVAEATYNGDGPAGDCGTTGTDGRFFWVRMTNNYEYAKVRDAVVNLPGVAALIEPGSVIS